MPALSHEAMEERREALLSAALACFARSGFRATSMRDICKEAGVSIGGLYTHFKSKEEIVLAIASAPRSDHDQIFSDAESAIAEGAPAHQAIADVIRTLMQFIDGEEGRERLNGDIAVMGEALGMPAIRKVLAETDASHLAAFTKLLATTMKPEEARPLADLLVSSLYGMMVLSAYHEDFDRGAAIDALERLLTHTL